MRTIVAPGSACSTVPLWQDRDLASGTSMASPAAAGTIARLVDGLVRHDPPLKVDNALILRAVRLTARHVPGLSRLDEGGGVLDLPAAYAHAVSLCTAGEATCLREYRIENQTPGVGLDMLYWRTCGALPRPTEPITFSVKSGLAKEMTEEDRARFYRAFDLVSDVPWLVPTRAMIYLKGARSAEVGLMADMTGASPGLHVGTVRAMRKSAGATHPEFELVAAVVVPHRATTENRGRLRTRGHVTPGGVDRVFVEVPPGTKALTWTLRLADGSWNARMRASLFAPDGVRRGSTASVSAGGRRSADGLASGGDIAPGVWEIAVSSGAESVDTACYDLEIRFSGLEFGPPVFSAPIEGVTQRRMRVPYRSMQARPFTGTVAASIEGLVCTALHTVQDSDRFTRTVTVDRSIARVRWEVSVDRETYGLFTDWVLQIEDAATGAVLADNALNDVRGTLGVTVPAEQKAPRQYRLVVAPAFTQGRDEKHWRLIVTESLLWRASPRALEVIAPQGGRLDLQPWEAGVAEFALPVQLPRAVAPYRLKASIEARGSGSSAPLRFSAPLMLDE